MHQHVCEALEYLHPDKVIRDAAHDANVKIQEFWVDEVSNNKALYNAFKVYANGNAQKEELTNKQHYFIDESIKDFEQAGLGLPDEQLEKVKKLKKEINTLSLDFERNIAEDNSTIIVAMQGLQGLTKDFIDNLKKTEDGNYILGVDYPTYFNVMDNCVVEDTRKRLNKVFKNRAYPKNEAILQQIIALRDELAQLIGFESYAHLDIDRQMAQTPERASSFLKDLIAKSEKKAQAEFEMLTAVLPESVTLAEGKIKPWDLNFLENEYKKNNFAIDERVIQEYFPMEHTIDQLLDIYRQFMSIEFEKVPVCGLWHEDVQAVKVYTKDRNTLLGILLLDLFPRPNKFSHAAHMTIIPGVKMPNGVFIPDVSIVMANFPKSTPTGPSLLKRDDVRTFFHEFGHAIHAILGATPIASMSGTNTKTDFVELPSQMLEEWLWDKNILKKVSKHYKTGDPLPDELIDKIIALKKLTTGIFIKRQLYLSMTALAYYQKGVQKDPYNIMKQLHEQIQKQIAFDPQNHFYASWGHLTWYAAKYYGYLWSNVFAHDVFDQIKKQGLLDSVIGQKYVHEILSSGGSQDPNMLLRNFLGRKPSNEAFLKDMGLI